MRKITFELCAETIDACYAGRDGGADRLELCSGLSEGGLTPSHALIGAAIKSSGLPVHVLVRPRGGNFFYTSNEIALMGEDILHIKSLGAAGVVLGLLNSDGSVDAAGTRKLVRLAHPMSVTFHRAFDMAASLPDALEDVIATGAVRLLTSGGKRDVVAGSSALAGLIRLAAGRIEVAVGGGLRLQNAASLARLTGAEHFHGSLRRKQSRNGHGGSETAQNQLEPSESTPGKLTSRHAPYVVDAGAVRAMVDRLRNA